jgi:hypothetical protein
MLQPMLDWALATDPAKRYPTVQEFAIDLSILIAAEPMDPVEPVTPVPPVEPTMIDTAASGEFVSPNAPTVADVPKSRDPEGRG